MPVNIFRRFLDAADALRLDLDAVRRLCGDERGPVGSCPCGGYLFVECPVQAYRAGGPVWVSLVCAACRRETACPDGRLAPHRRITGAA